MLLSHIASFLLLWRAFSPVFFVEDPLSPLSQLHKHGSLLQGYANNGCKTCCHLCLSNYQNTKAAISRKWIQRAPHMNEHMNKNEVVFMSDLCQEERERERRRRWVGGKWWRHETRWNKSSGWSIVLKGSGHNYLQKCLLNGWAQKCI